MSKGKRRGNNNDYTESNATPKDVVRKTKRGSKRRVSEKLGSIRSLEDAELFEDEEVPE